MPCAHQTLPKRSSDIKKLRSPSTVTKVAKCFPFSMKGVDLRFSRADNPDYDRAFDEAARAIYEMITSRVCHGSVRVG